MSVVIFLLSLVLILTCLFLVLLVLVQLPKKEAGAGMAFGSSMGEMILGAGSGNVLTKITKYTAGIFLGAALLLSWLVSHRAHLNETGVSRALEQAATAPATPPAPAAPAGFQPLVSLTNDNAPATVTNTVTVTATNAPAAAANRPGN